MAARRGFPEIAAPWNDTILQYNAIACNGCTAICNSLVVAQAPLTMFAAAIVPRLCFTMLQLCSETYVMARRLCVVTSFCCSIINLYAGFTVLCQLVPQHPVTRAVRSCAANFCSEGSQRRGQAPLTWGHVFPQQIEDGVWWAWSRTGATSQDVGLVVPCRPAVH